MTLLTPPGKVSSELESIKLLKFFIFSLKDSAKASLLGPMIIKENKVSDIIPEYLVKSSSYPVARVTKEDIKRDDTGAIKVQIKLQNKKPETHPHLSSYLSYTLQPNN